MIFIVMNVQQLQPGDVLLTKGNGIISNAIKCFTSSDYSHAALVVPAWGDEVLVMQAWTFGIEIVPITRAVEEFGTSVDVFRLNAPDDVQVNLDFEKLLHAALGFVGRRYDYLGILRLAFLIFIGQRRKAVSRKTQRLFCSEYVQKVFRAGGVELTTFGDQVVEPGDLARCKMLRLVGTLEV